MWKLIKFAFGGGIKRAMKTLCCFECAVVRDFCHADMDGHKPIRARHGAFRLIQNENGYWLLLMDFDEALNKGTWQHIPISIAGLDGLMKSLHRDSGESDKMRDILELAKRYKAGENWDSLLMDYSRQFGEGDKRKENLIVAGATSIDR